ncbi:hypothetical protein FJY93_04420 [Candidatus Kaiserbacteria bacterium]|nr:hypothetical protein [Candidatus Kaiserbacteria bacterium]
MARRRYYAVKLETDEEVIMYGLLIMEPEDASCTDCPNGLGILARRRAELDINTNCANTVEFSFDLPYVIAVESGYRPHRLVTLAPEEQEKFWTGFKA